MELSNHRSTIPNSRDVFSIYISGRCLQKSWDGIRQGACQHCASQSLTQWLCTQHWGESYHWNILSAVCLLHSLMRNRYSCLNDTGWWRANSSEYFPRGTLYLVSDRNCDWGRQITTLMQQHLSHEYNSNVSPQRPSYANMTAWNNSQVKLRAVTKENWILHIHNGLLL